MPKCAFASLTQVVGDGSPPPPMVGNTASNRTYRLEVLKAFIPSFIEVRAGVEHQHWTLNYSPP